MKTLDHLKMQMYSDEDHLLPPLSPFFPLEIRLECCDIWCQIIVILHLLLGNPAEFLFQILSVWLDVGRQYSIQHYDEVTKSND